MASAKFSPTSPVFAEGDAEVTREQTPNKTKERWKVVSPKGTVLLLSLDQIEDLADALDMALEWAEKQNTGWRDTPRHLHSL